ncbi:MAG: hypothetical protein B9S32_01095 [Verrucomicrobia bacterium Tous-C9LFEB]|nr:MAG: hypothetical protein B9S32_01095 [Verrucomicrobia bacterium Tous-C9LFEB]
MSTLHLHFTSKNQTLTANHGDNLLEKIIEANLDIDNACNGMGSCGKCRVQLDPATAPAPLEDELRLLESDELRDGIRLACLHRIQHDLALDIVSERNTGDTVRVLEDGLTVNTDIEGASLEKIYVELPAPTLEDNGTDEQRLSSRVGADYHNGNHLRLLRKLPVVLRDSRHKVTAVLYNGEIIDVEPGDTTRRLYGVAVDIGTTTVVAAIIDLNTRKEIGSAAAVNAQRSFGQDVISRIQYAEAGGQEQLRLLIIEQLNSLVEQAATTAKIDVGSIYEIAIAANSTMLHLLLGISAASLSTAPYQAVFRNSVGIRAIETGLRIAEAGILYLLPSVSSYVGADIVAGVIATDMHLADEPALLVDIGTNGEIIFGSKDGFVACSCAAGPAFEGMNISCGSVAITGSIEAVRISPGKVDIKTIGHAPANGICGSGIVDVVAQLVLTGIVQSNGRFSKEAATLYADRLRNDGGQKFNLTEDGNVYISQKDIRQVQLAKGAIASAIEVLLRELGERSARIQHVYIAGAFGKHLNIESLALLGMIPPAFANKVSFVGNTSKTGAVKCLLSRRYKEEAHAVLDRTKYLELSVYPGYESLFVESIAFPSPPSTSTPQPQTGEALTVPTA